MKAANSVVYTIPVPPSANKIWRHIISSSGKPRTLKSRNYLAWLEDVNLALRLQGIREFEGPVKVSLQVEGGRDFEGARDLDNLWKPTLDALRQIGILKEDNVRHVTELHAYYIPVPGPTRCLVTIQSLGELRT